MNKLLAILGPTSTGKTDFALQLANKFQGELISCDSRQVYKGLDIGTGKLPGQKVAVEKNKGFWKMDGVKVWLYDMADPKKQYTVYDYIKDATVAINKIRKQDKLPIIVGGTGYYLKALLEGIPNLEIPINIDLRERLAELSLEQLQKKLQKIDLQRWEKMNYSDRQNPRRLIRAIEIKENSIVKYQMSNFKLKSQYSNILKIGLIAPRQILYKRIDERVISRVKQGMIKEAENLYKKGLTFERMRQLGLEYRALANYLSGQISSKEELIKTLQGKIHGFARRQITWFKKEKNVKWFDITDPNYLYKVEELVSEWYDRTI